MERIRHNYRSNALLIRNDWELIVRIHRRSSYAFGSNDRSIESPDLRCVSHKDVYVSDDVDVMTGIEQHIEFQASRIRGVRMSSCSFGIIVIFDAIDVSAFVTTLLSSEVLYSVTVI